MNRLIVAITIVFFVMNPAGITAQGISFHHLTAEDGLSQNAVLSLSQDHNGFIWIGTSNGLNRYDGYRIKVYEARNDDPVTLSSNNILSLKQDSKKRLWVGTYMGLNRYNHLQDRFTRIPSPVSYQLAYYQIYEDQKGNIWMATSEGIYTLDNVADTLKKIILPLTNSTSVKTDVRAVLVDRKDNVWVGTTNGLIKMQVQQNVATGVTYTRNIQFPETVSANFITALAEDRFGRIWIGTLNSGIDIYDPQTQKFTHLNSNNTEKKLIHNNIRRIFVSNTGQIWIGTQEGITILNEDFDVVEHLQQNDGVSQSLSQNSIHAIFQDQTGNMWVGTYFGGLNYTNVIHTDFKVLRKKDQNNYLNNNVISSIVEDENNNLWIGTEGGGLNYFKRKEGSFVVYKNEGQDDGEIGSNLIKYVYRDRHGRIWVGTHRGGLNVFDPVSKKFKKYLFKENDPSTLNSEILSIYEDSRGRFWIGSTEGIRIFDNTDHGLTERVDYYKGAEVMKHTAYYFLEDDQQRLWIATAEGLYCFRNGVFDKITDDIVNCVIQDSKSAIWLGMRKGGLARFNEQTGKLEIYNQAGKIGNRNIVGILEDQIGNLWLSSDNGLIKFNAGSDLFQVFTESDGLAGKSFNYNSFFKDSKGMFWFGGFGGITYFYPEQIQANLKPANLVLTDLKLFNETLIPAAGGEILDKAVAYTDDIVLRYNQNMITVDFALLNYIKSSKNAFAYMLEGYDKNWVYTSEPTASYTNLPSGKYNFVVKGANNDGVWSPVQKLKITILPPFWLSWWAFLIYSLAVGAVVFVVVRYFFLGALLKKEEELHQVKLNFFTNVSHEIRTHLTLIMTPVDKMLESDATSSFVKDKLIGVKSNANRLLKLVGELMDFRKAETNNLKLSVGQYDLVAFLEDIYNSFTEVSIKKNISFSFVHNNDVLPLYFDKEQLEKVFFNLLANAFRFTQEEGNILVEVTENEKEVIVCVTDNGKGIALDYIDKIFTNFFQVAEDGKQNTGYGIGLALAKTIVTLHKGDILAESVPVADSGESRTSFKVFLKKGKLHFDQGEVKSDALIPSVRAQDSTMTDMNKVYQNENDTTKTETILIVEDNPELKKMVREIFEPNYTVIEAVNGKEGLNIAYTEIPDIIVSDIMMPEMDGIELCRILKTDNRTSHIPVVLLTAKSTQNDKITGLENGADIYITKPFSPKILQLSIRNLLSAREKLRNSLRAQFIDPISEKPVSFAAKEMNTVDKEYLDRAVSFVEENMDNPEFGVEMLSRHMAMSVPVLYKKLKAITQMSVNDFIKSIRLRRAAELLQEQRLNVNEVSMEVGFKDRRYFSQEFRKQYGKTPREFIQDYRPPTS
jgi:ligand-binding sensor domain-containing protein/signal transduction histidine kinase/DNA-binding response OmpR family regulator